MEYCAHCRAIRPTRKSTRRRTVRQPDGTVKTLIVDSFHCTRCNHFVGSIEREAAAAGPAHAASTGPSAVAPDETETAAAEAASEEVEATNSE